MELFRLSAGVDIVGVPYKGSGQALTDLIGGQLPLMFDGMTSAGPQVKGGRIRAFAISSTERARGFPEVPTLGESGVEGLKDYDVKGWTAVLAPHGTPNAIIDRIHAEVNAVVATPEVRTRLNQQNLEAFAPISRTEAAAYIHGEIAKWAKVAREAKL